MNSLSSERYNLLPLEVEVTCAAVSADGAWLVTSEYRNDGVNYPEEKLKFFAAQPNKNTSPFTLNTHVNLSHGGCRVVSLALNNKGEFCVSSGNDQKFRVWKRDDTAHEKKAWYCLTACYYSSGVAHFLGNPALNKFKIGEVINLSEVTDYPYLKNVTKDDVVAKLFNVHRQDGESLADERVVGASGADEWSMGGVAISQDGSLIAAWFGCKLTLWDSHLCSLRTVLSHPALQPRGVHVQFGNNDAAHYVSQFNLFLT